MDVRGDAGHAAGARQPRGAEQDAPLPIWRAEPFRVFFPLAVVLGWAGIGHWLLYALGVTLTYSCTAHGIVQTQSFMLAFAVGFLLTAIPRRTASAAPSHVEIATAFALLAITAAAALVEQDLIAHAAYACVFALVLRFAVQRFRAGTRRRRPPAGFVLVPVAVGSGLVGATLLVASSKGVLPGWAHRFGRLLVQQGVFLCLAVGVGSLVLPLMSGAPPPADLGSSPRETRKAIGYAVVGLAILASLALEARGWLRAAPLARALAVAIGLGVGGGAWRRPSKPGLHRRFVWLSVWLMPLGLSLAALWPDYRVPALHVLFIGGFGLMAFGVATHVTLSHLGLERLREGRPAAVAVLGVAVLLAMLARVTADWTDTYFTHIGWAAGAWLAGKAWWLVFIAAKLRRGTRTGPTP